MISAQRTLPPRTSGFPSPPQDGGPKWDVRFANCSPKGRGGCFAWRRTPRAAFVPHLPWADVFLPFQGGNLAARCLAMREAA